MARRRAKTQPNSSMGRRKQGSHIRPGFPNPKKGAKKLERRLENKGEIQLSPRDRESGSEYGFTEMNYGRGRNYSTHIIY